MHPASYQTFIWHHCICAPLVFGVVMGLELFI